MNTFIYNEQLYLRCIPSKALFRSSLVHEVVNRGDIFAVRLSDQQLTIVPGLAQVTHTTHELTITGPAPTTNKTPTASSISAAAAKAKLKRLAESLRHEQQQKQCTLFGC